MTRQNYNVNTSEKKIEVFSSFAGGMVTQPHPEKLDSHQSVLVENADVLSGGVIKNRGAYAQTNAGSVVGMTQGRFKYQHITNAHDIVAVQGKLYKVVDNEYTEIPITGLTSFQTTRLIDAVQLREKLYFATGSGLVMYDGTTAAMVTAYAPNGLEALYIGTNGYAEEPEEYLSDTTGAGNLILGVVPSERYGLVNVDITFTAFIQKVVSDTLEYQFETKRVDQAVEDYNVDQVFSTAKTFVKKFTTKADYMVRVSMRKQGETVILSQYVLPRYKVNTTPDEKPEPNVTFAQLSTCNRLFIHYDRLFMYGDTTNPDALYISHLNKFDYFPRTNVMNISDPLRGQLENVVRFKEFLVCFTDGSIQMISGMSPQDFTLQPVHTTLGTKSRYSVQVMQNYIVFVGNDNGVYVLKTFNFASNNKMNVERIDDALKDKLSSFITDSTTVLSAIYDTQYYLYIEKGEERHIYRFYYDLGIWVRDSLPFSVNTMENINNKLTLTSPTNGTIYTLTPGVFRDGEDEIFSMRVTSKNFNMDIPHHRKKLKEYQLLAKLSSKNTILVDVYADDNIITRTALNSDPLQNSDSQKLKVIASGRFRYTKTDISIIIHEDVQLTGFGFIFKTNTPK